MRALLSVVVLIAGLLLLWPAGASAQRDDWKRHMAAAATAARQSNFTEALEHLKAAVAIVEKSAPNDNRLERTLNTLAKLYRRQGKHSEAETVYKRLIAVHRNQGRRDDPIVADLLFKLALGYQTRGRHAEAEPLLEETLRIVENAFGTRDLKSALTLSALAKTYPSPKKTPKGRARIQTRFEIAGGT